MAVETLLKTLRHYHSTALFCKHKPRQQTSILASTRFIEAELVF